jgi:predicted lipoprotein with Yx(FWY)xxD motif
MPRSAKISRGRLGGAQHRRRSAAVVIALVAGFAIAALAGLAVAKGTDTLGVAKNVKVGSQHEAIVVNSRGLTVYDLVPESTKHPLCTKASGCLHFWFPVTVRSKSTKLTAATGVKGKLALWHHNGSFQVMLGGHPLYTFKFDNKTKGMATGDKVATFGGVWHVLKASVPRKATNPGATTTSTSSSYSYPPGY